VPAVTGNTEVLLARRPSGWVTEDCFETRVGAIPEPGPGDVLVRLVYLSCDPYLRGRMDGAFPLGEPMVARAVGEVAASDNAAWPEGTIVWGFMPWAEWALVPGGAGLRRVDPTLGPISHAVSVLGMPGLTAWVGMVDIGHPAPGETVVVSSAAGAVGSLAGQLAKLAGARVVGIAGGPAKCAHVVDRLGFDACIDHRGGPLRDALRQHCPDRIDVYFDNVGGPTLAAVLDRLNPFARIPVCGMISQYNEPAVGIDNLINVLGSRATMTGFSIYDHVHELDRYLPTMARLLRSGRVVYFDDVVEGIDQLVGAFIGMLRGENVGKRLVRVGGDPTAPESRFTGIRPA
jgi:NADPH-dependent curcumin reductase CurA